MPRFVNSRASASSPAMRSESSFEITSAATFLPAKLTSRAAGVFHTEVHLTSAASAAIAQLSRGFIWILVSFTSFTLGFARPALPFGRALPTLNPIRAEDDGNQQRDE